MTVSTQFLLVYYPFCDAQASSAFSALIYNGKILRSRFSKMGIDPTELGVDYLLRRESKKNRCITRAFSGVENPFLFSDLAALKKPPNQKIKRRLFNVREGSD